MNTKKMTLILLSVVTLIGAACAIAFHVYQPKHSSQPGTLSQPIAPSAPTAEQNEQELNTLLAALSSQSNSALQQSAGAPELIAQFFTGDQVAAQMVTQATALGATCMGDETETSITCELDDLAFSVTVNVTNHRIDVAQMDNDALTAARKMTRSRMDIVMQWAT